MRNPLSIAVAQPPCAPYDVEANGETHAATVCSAGTRVVVFPELSLTGYELDAPAISVADRRLTPIVQACAKTGTVALAGAPVEDERGRTHIAMLAIEGNGAAVAYRKMWLSFAESRRFIPGDKPTVLQVDGWRLGLAICKDANTPEHAAATAALGIDAYVAGVLNSPAETAAQEERARRVAADDHVWVAVASFAGSTGGGYAEAAGRSAIWSPGGAMAAQAGTEPGDIATARTT